MACRASLGASGDLTVPAWGCQVAALDGRGMAEGLPSGGQQCGEQLLRVPEPHTQVADRPRRLCCPLLLRGCPRMATAQRRPPCPLAAPKSLPQCLTRNCVSCTADLKTCLDCDASEQRRRTGRASRAGLAAAAAVGGKHAAEPDSAPPAGRPTAACSPPGGCSSTLPAAFATSLLPLCCRLLSERPEGVPALQGRVRAVQPPQPGSVHRVLSGLRAGHSHQEMCQGGLHSEQQTLECS